ncbi:HAD family hydrolase [Brevibacillus porteri]|uniref:Uncharacterized protein n=1 Tax=Brevibacillus porteri TaxID=2126350 RepID=A0ABX5FWG0_9BACL|nr:HAD family hydrolase [Brevibacillus porteri]MED1798845.1 HAD family hydrolase [Brevibacillus porteri]MED2131528.1 HAD family hydrolase [Brevibacillus porteri]MED2744081.1 HAD family hydrolase [Brevibacillus porteri]MED2813295.1 HAD family hydrolase [Brevibacillus porteri]MED2896613.1 HAD family hydrolase [Brevibacillus porteri]
MKDYDAVARFKDAGIERTVIMTGDNRATHQAIAKQIGIDDIHAKILPTDKVKAANELKEKYGKNAMVRDGIEPNLV